METPVVLGSLDRVPEGAFCSGDALVGFGGEAGAAIGMR